MTATSRIPDDMVSPGDRVELEYLVERGGDNSVILMLCVNDVEKQIDADPRFDLRTTRFEDRTDLETGKVYKYVIFNIYVRETAKNDERIVYEAGLGIPIMLIVGLIVAGAVAWQYLKLERSRVEHGTARIKAAAMEKINQDPNLTPEQKTRQIEQISVPSSSGGGIVSRAIASFGIGGLAVAGLVLYAVLIRRPLIRTSSSAYD